MLADFTPEDLALIQQMARAFKAQGLNLFSRGTREGGLTEGADQQAPEFYIAKPASSTGIAPMSRVGTGSFAPPTDGDVPGEGLCDIYKLAGGELVQVGVQRTVHNISEEQVTEDWIFVQRDKFGTWWAINEISEGTWGGIAQSAIAKGAYGLIRRDSNGEDESVLANLGSVLNGAQCLVSMVDGIYKVVNSECEVP